MEQRNLTPFPMQVWDSYTSTGELVGTLLIRARYRFKAEGKNWHLKLVPDQGSLFGADQYYAETGQSSLRYESDFIPYKKTTDLVLNTFSYAPGSKASPHWQAGIIVGKHQYVLNIVGPRYWQRSWGWHLSKAEPIRKLPVRYEYAFGGSIIDPEKAEGDPQRFIAFDQRNPIGRGLLHKQQKDKLVAAPQIESPHQRIDEQDPYLKPEPQGLGFYHRSWQPRLTLAGNYDDEWLNHQHPYPPHNFDYRHNQGAHPNLIWSRYMQGGETIRLINLTPEVAQAKIILPKPRLMWLLEDHKGSKLYNKMSLDTVLLDIDNGLENGYAYLSWRTRLPINPTHRRISAVLLSGER